MTIKDAKAFEENLELNEPYSISLSTQYKANYVLVVVKDDNETLGIGEASPLPAYKAETQETILRAVNQDLAPKIIGFDEFAISRICEQMDDCMEDNLMAKSAIEMALHDLVCKKLRVPIISYLGGPVRESVRVAGSIGFLPSSIAFNKVRTLTENGFTTMKVKIGQSKDKDLELVRTVRKAGGKDINIRLDANQAFSADKAIPILKELEMFEPELFEQPVIQDDLQGMAKIAKEIDTPVMADEPIVGPKDVIRFAEADAADLVKVKLNRCGGIRKTWLMSELARSYGLKVVIGSGHESSIGVAAESALALSGSNFHDVGEMNGNQRLVQEIVENPILPQAGTIRPWSRSGLGLNLIVDGES